MDTWGLLGQALECSVCLEQLDTTSRVLPCQHTFCRKCLVDIINTRKELRCPECRVLVTVPFNSLPSNILLLRILEGIKSIPNNASTSSNQPDSTNQSNFQSQPATDPFSIFCNVNDSISSDSQTSNVSDRNNELSSQIGSNNPFFQPNLNLSNVGVDNDPSVPTTQTVPHSNNSRENSISPDTRSQLNGILSGTVQPCLAIDSVNQLIDKCENTFPLSSSNRNSLVSGTMTVSSPVSQNQQRSDVIVNNRSTESNTDILSAAQPSILSSDLNNLSSTTPSVSRMSSSNFQIDSLLCGSLNEQRNVFQSSESPLINIRSNIARQLSSKSLRESQSYIPPLNLQAKALYNYNGKEARDLKFKKGDTITITKQIDENWYQGELDGNVGIVPSSYIKFLDCSSSHIPQCKALYDFKMVSEEERNCLMFSKGDTITILRRIDENWAEGKLSTHIGIFPFSFVELNEAAKTLLRLSESVSSSSITPTTSGPTSSLSTVSSSSNTSAPICSILSPLPVHTTSPQPVQTHSSNKTQPTNQNCLPEFQSCPSLPSWASSQSTSRLCGVPPSANVCASPSKPSPTSDRSKKSDVGRPHSDIDARGISFNLATLENLQLYIAMHSYHPRKADELELKKGLLYSVADKCQDGWFKGRCLSTDKIGVFPGNYVQIADAQAISSALSPRYSSVNIASYISDIRRDNIGLNKAKCSSPQSQTGSLGDVRNLNGVTGPPELPPRSIASSSSAKNSTTLSRSNNSTLERPASASEISTRVSSPISHQGDKKCSSKDRSVSNGGGISLIRTLRAGGKKTTKSPPLLSLDNPVFDDVTTNKARIVACDNNTKNSDTIMKSTKQPAPLVKERYRCIVPYPANSTSELELQLGDIVYVYKKREDGWFKGTHQRTGKTGLFPSIFVESY